MIIETERGLVRRPVIAVPTSIGYGASFSGVAALLGMLNSCAAGVTVVNIDNGPANRCYFYKKILFGQLKNLAEKITARWVCFGENVDDQFDYRPGSQAALEFAVRAPLKEAGLDKQKIRLLAKQLGLPVWDKPAATCLASRFPYGVEIMPERLSQVEKAEDFLWRLGFHQCRVRYHGEVARIEVEPEKMGALLAHADHITERFRKLGFTYTALDLAGYRRGSLNESAQPLSPGDLSISKNSVSGLFCRHQRGYGCRGVARPGFKPAGIRARTSQTAVGRIQAED